MLSANEDAYANDKEKSNIYVEQDKKSILKVLANIQLSAKAASNSSNDGLSVAVADALSKVLEELRNEDEDLFWDVSDAANSTR